MNNATSPRPKRDRHLSWVNAHELQVNPVTQREFRPAWAASILAAWDLEKYQEPHVNRRADGGLFIMEGQHGTWAYREKYAEEGKDLPVQVWLYEGLTEQQEAEFFLALNNKKAVDLMAKFKVGVIAGREVESDIDRIVRANGCSVTGDGSTNNAITAVGALMSIYGSRGARNLADTIAVIRDAFGHGGFERPILIGVSMVLARYDLHAVDMVPALLNLRGGSKGLIQSAYRVRESMGGTLNDAAAAAIVEQLNKGRRGGKRLPSWFAAEIAA